MKLYFCVGCRQLHYDEDYSESDGDLLIYHHDKFFKSVEDVKKTFKEKSSALVLEDGHGN